MMAQNKIYADQTCSLYDDIWRLRKFLEDKELESYSDDEDSKDCISIGCFSDSYDEAYSVLL